MQLELPRFEYWPAGQGVEVPTVEAGPQVYPAGQGPVQEGDDMPDAAPKAPAGHGVHAAAPLPL